MARSAPRSDLALVAIAGDIDEGRVFALDPDNVLVIGRTSKGLRLLDPMVSVRHSEIRFDLARGYVIRDLDSVTGTWVDDECLKGTERPIGIGTRLRFGETTMVVKRKGGISSGLLWFVAMFIATGLILATVSVGRDFRETTPDMVELGEEWGIGSLGTVSKVLPDARWLRERGLHTDDLKVREITDYDYDSLPELWLHSPQGVHPVTFTSEGQWVGLGDLPKGCVSPKNIGEGFPVLDCDSVMWVKGADAYEIVRMDGVVVWYHEPVEAPPPDPDAEPLNGRTFNPVDLPLKVARVTLRNPEKLAKFLAARNVSESVHYIICEDAFRDIRSQALVSHGAIQPLSPVCLSELRLLGVSIAGDPVAVALTARGHEALIADVTRFYAGHPDALFLPGERRAVVEQLKAPPGLLLGGAKLQTELHEDSPLPYFNPVPPEPDRSLPTHALDSTLDRRDMAAPVAKTVTLLQSGTSKEIETTGCGRLRIRVEEFICFGWCESEFLVVEDVGCEEKPQVLINAGRGSGAHTAVVDGVEVKAVIESRLGGNGNDVMRARVTWRELP